MKCCGVDTLLVGDTGLFSVVDGPASLWNCLYGSISGSPYLRAYVAPYLPPIGSYGFYSLGGGEGGNGSVGGSVSSMGLSGSDLGFASSGMAGIGSMYNSIKECSHLCPWLQRRGERARCSREGGSGSSGRGRGRGSDCGGQGGDGVCVGDRGSTTSGAWGCNSSGKADGKMTAWFLVSGAGVIDGMWPDDEKGGKKDGKGERNLSHALFCLMAALTLSVAHSMTP